MIDIHVKSIMDPLLEIGLSLEMHVANLILLMVLQAVNFQF